MSKKLELEWEARTQTEMNMEHKMFNTVFCLYIWSHNLYVAGGPVAMGGAPLLSATWFPAEQRTTATAIAAVMNGVGVSISFIIGENAVAYLHCPTPIPRPIPVPRQGE